MKNIHVVTIAVAVVLIFAVAIGALAQKEQREQRPAPIVYLPPCDIAIIGAAARALIGPDIVAPAPVDPAPEFCEGRVCTAHRDAIVAKDRAARALVEYQRWRALDYAIVACGY